MPCVVDKVQTLPCSSISIFEPPPNDIFGKYEYKFDLIQDGFAWMTSKKSEKKMIKTMKKGSRIMVTGHTQNGSQTIDHYSLLGFTKAYNATKANCS